MSESSIVSITPRYREALDWAATLHQHQMRKGKPVPYLSHLLAVSALIWEDGGDEDQAIAWLLHDAIEDTDVTYEEVHRRFGKDVADMVQHCTDTAPGQTRKKKEPWKERKVRYLETLRKKPERSLWVSAADKAHNASDILFDVSRDEKAWKRFSGGMQGTLWYLHTLHQVFQERIPLSRSAQLLGGTLERLFEGPEVLREAPGGTDVRLWASRVPGI